MPTVPLHINPSIYNNDKPKTTNPLPGILQTPSGLAIVEIQGVIHAETPPIPASTTDGYIPAQTPVGELVFPHYDASAPADDTKWMKRAYLYVGKHQRMTGEVKKLAKPYGLLQKRETTGDGAEELEIVEIVRYKIIFASRPEPVGDVEMG